MSLNITDRASDFLKESTRERTPEGFLRVKGRVARSGIQRYYGYELGLKDKPYKLVSLYRPKDVVLSDDVCKMFKGVDITNNHPENFVNSNNYRNLTSGVVLSDAYRDPENDNFIMCDMLIKDAETIKALESGKAQLSVGYSNEIDMTPGKTPEGEQYDAKVSKITMVNHVALVSRARAGIDARVIDAVGGKMAILKLSDTEIELDDSIAKQIQSHIDEINAEKEDALKEVETKDAELGELTAKIQDLQDELEEAHSLVMTDEAMQQAFKLKEKLINDARKIAGEKFTCEAFDSLEIMKAAIEGSGCTVDLEDKSEDFITGFFNAAVANSDSNSVSKSHKAVAKAMVDACGKKGEDDDPDDRKSAEQKEKERIGNAFKNKQ